MLDIDLQTRLNAILDDLTISAKNVTNFAVEQISLVAQEAVKWGFVSNLFQAAFYLFLTLLCSILAWHFIRLRNKFSVNKEDNGKYCFSIIWAGVFIILGIISFSGGGVVSHSLTAIKAKFAPRIYLLEYCNDLRKEISSESNVVTVQNRK